MMVFTRDLRVTDNPALAAAAQARDLVPLFVFDDALQLAWPGCGTGPVISSQGV